MRLDKFLSNENIGSRKAVSTLVRSGAVAVNGQAVRKSDIQIDPEKDEITFQNGMPHLNGYTLFFEQYGVHFLAAAEEA